MSKVTTLEPLGESIDFYREDPPRYLWYIFWKSHFNAP